MMTARDDLARVLEAHSPASHALSLKLADAVICEWLSARADRRLELLRAVVAYDAANQSDLPLGLLDALRAEVDCA